MTDKHTPTPKVRLGHVQKVVVLNLDGTVFAKCKTQRQARELVVLVNSHAALVEALRRAAISLEWGAAEAKCSGQRDVLTQAAKDARAALAQAEEGK